MTLSTAASKFILITAASLNIGAYGFAPPPASWASKVLNNSGSVPSIRPSTIASSMTSVVGESFDTATNSSDEFQKLSTDISKLKRVLTQEYISFFNPMVSSWYAADVSFDDPMTSLSGVDSYRKNVDMLAGRTLMGKILFEGAGINLHSVTGGEITEDESGNLKISELVTRWTLRVTAKVLPWKPTAVFSGISVYNVKPGGKEGVEITGQTDYWDSINIKPNTPLSPPQNQYQKVPTNIAVQDFLNQLKPEGFTAAAAAPELPYLLLRRGDGYELRRYPGFIGIETPYVRRDYGFGSLGAFTKGMDPLAPSIMKVWNEDDLNEEEPNDKTMTWPLKFTNPGEGTDAPDPPASAVEKAGDGQWKSISIARTPERVIAVRTFEDAAMAPVVRNADRELREILKTDGLTPREGSEKFVVFSQYDAVHSMGKRRSEVWIELADGGHPF
mmetsp:Transcript_31843/g.67515  ORF Transcript_31843/g.67515 Transcript_31843/m.67515 type:complete len:445 (-) Transcript_31843:133-1467(-)